MPRPEIERSKAQIVFSGGPLDGCEGKVMGWMEHAGVIDCHRAGRYVRDGSYWEWFSDRSDE